MEILYIYLSKTLFYFILLPKTLMFSLSEYLSRCQPGPGEGSDGVWVLALRWGGVHTDGGYQTVNGLY